jgi:transaldolase
VASFFVSRIDSSIDARLKEIATPAASALLGKAAIANAQLAYQLYENTQLSPRWRALSEAGANMQRPLWASTGVKDPAYSDTRYVIELIAKNVVNTMPPKTLDAVIDHGKFVGDTITPNYQSAKATLQALAEIGISLDEVTDLLEDDGINKFIGSWLALLDDVEKVLAQ